MTSKAIHRVAVIGAGAAGTAAAYRLWCASQGRGLADGQQLGQLGDQRLKQLGDQELRQVEVTVFERLEHAGGRARSVDFAGSRVESGAALLHSSGKLSRELAKLAKCKQSAPGFSIDSQEDSYGFWTDKGFAVLTSSSRKAMAAAVLGYAGPAAAMKVLRSAREKAAKWQQVYQLLADGQDFDTPQQLFAALGLSELTRMSVRQYLEGLGINQRMSDHIIEPVLKTMYSQGAGIGALAGLVALTGAGLAGGKLFAISNGNFTLYDKVLRHIGAKLRFGTEVKAVRQLAAGRGQGFRDSGPKPDGSDGGSGGDTGADGSLGANGGGLGTNGGLGANGGGLGTNGGDTGYRGDGFEVVCADGSCYGFDAVVLAAPYTSAGLELTADGLAPPPTLPYFDVEVTLVAGRLNPAYFKAKPGKALPNLIFTADSAGAMFKSIGIGGFSPIHNMPIYRVVSSEAPLAWHDRLSDVFAEVADICHLNWHKSCPRLAPDIEPLPFLLAPGLFYACALDSIASTLEMESIGGWNSGGLVLRHLYSLR